MNIPVIGTAIVNGPHWVKRLIESIDYPVDNFIIFNNNGRGQITQELDEIVNIEHPFIEKLSVTHMPANVGCSGAWNLIIKCFMLAPYWIITGHDISFTPGFLKKMVELSDDVEVGMVHGSGGDFGDGGYELFLIKDWVIQKYGLFDENLYPGYGEDADYIMRLKHNPIKRISSVGLPFLHGEGTNYYATGQQTKRTEPELVKKLNFANETNFSYLTEKWGIGWRQTWPWTSPFNNPSMPLSTTTYNLEYVRKKHLGF